MKLKNSNKNILKHKMYSLMDEVRLNLDKGLSIDDFLDETDLFNDWESIIPDKEYPIFVIAILNNIRKDTIINTILDSLSTNDQKKTKQACHSRKNKLVSHVGELPFN